MAVLNNARTTGIKLLDHNVALDDNAPTAVLSEDFLDSRATRTSLSTFSAPVPKPAPQGGLVLLSPTGGVRG
jgi:hypothetical protein